MSIKNVLIQIEIDYTFIVCLFRMLVALPLEMLGVFPPHFSSICLKIYLGENQWETNIKTYIYTERHPITSIQ